jgi:hypothetical protein
MKTVKKIEIVESMKSLSFPEVKDTTSVKKIKSAEAAVYGILVEMLTEQEASGSSFVISQDPSKQAYITSIGCLVNKDSGLEVGQRVLLQGQYVPMPIKSASGRVLGCIDMSNIKAILHEEN